jgi:hypothetical protein
MAILIAWKGLSSKRSLCRRGAVALLGLASRTCGAALEVIEYEQADRRRQIALLPVFVDLVNCIS